MRKNLKTVCLKGTTAVFYLLFFNFIPISSFSFSTTVFLPKYPNESGPKILGEPLKNLQVPNFSQPNPSDIHKSVAITQNDLSRARQAFELNNEVLNRYQDKLKNEQDRLSRTRENLDAKYTDKDDSTYRAQLDEIIQREKEIQEGQKVLDKEKEENKRVSEEISLQEQILNRNKEIQKRLIDLEEKQNLANMSEQKERANQLNQAKRELETAWKTEQQATNNAGDDASFHRGTTDKVMQQAADTADFGKPFSGSTEGTPVADTSPSTNSSSPPVAQPLIPQSLTGGNSQLQEINAVIEGQATASTKLHDQMSTLAKRANDRSLSESINGRSNDGYQSNQGKAYIDGETVPGRYFEDVHGGGRYFVPDSAYGGKGLDGYMAKRTTDLSGLHQLNGTIASGNATRVGSNIQFDGFYNGNQAYRNGMWNAPANGSQASRTNIPFSPINSVSPVQAAPKLPANTSTAQTQTPLSQFWSRLGQFLFGRIW